MPTHDLLMENAAYDLVVASPNNDFIACFTATRSIPDSSIAPVSTLAIFAAHSATVLGTWNLRNELFWTADREVPPTEPGIWDEAARTYSHEVWRNGQAETRIFTF